MRQRHSLCTWRDGKVLRIFVRGNFLGKNKESSIDCVGKFRAVDGDGIDGGIGFWEEEIFWEKFIYGMETE